MSDITETNDAPPAGGAVPTPPPVVTSQSLREAALAGLDGESRASVLQDAADVGVHDKNDSAWMLFRRLRDAHDAADQAARAADRIEATAKSVGGMVYNETTRAGKDLNATMSKTLNDNMARTAAGLAKVIDAAANQGAAAISAAAASLEAHASKKSGQFIESWKTLAAQAMNETAKAAVQRATSIRWAMILTTIIISMVLGGTMSWYLVDATGHLLPWSEPLALVNGHVNCGFVRALGNRVCEVQ